MAASGFIQKEQIAFAFKIFNQEDCLTYLDRDVISKGYRPINITLINNTDKYIYLSKSNFSFPCVSSLEVAQKVHTSTAKRAIGYGIAGLFIWPFLIPALVDGIGSAEANQKLDRDFRAKALRNQTIAPYTTVNGLIFVANENFSHEFSFTVIDIESNKRLLLSTTALNLEI